MNLERITVGDKAGRAAYFDANFEMVPSDDPSAVLAKVVFDDGSRAFYTVSEGAPRTAEYNPNQERDERGRWVVMGGETVDADPPSASQQFHPEAERRLREMVRAGSDTPLTLKFKGDAPTDAARYVAVSLLAEGYRPTSANPLPDGSEIAIFRNQTTGDFAVAHVAGSRLTVHTGRIEKVGHTITRIHEQAFGEQQTKLLRTYLERNAVRAFHGTTTAALESIRKDGLVPEAEPGADEAAGGMAKGERPASVYMGTDRVMALTFGVGATQVRGGKPIVLQVEVPEEERKNLKPDEMMSSHALAIRYEHTIPPSWIKRVGEIVEDPKYAAGGYIEWKPFKAPRARKGKGGKARHAAASRGPATLYAVVMVDEGAEPRTAGGPGSGNFGHAGRPGEVGGSAPDGGGTGSAGSTNENTRKFMARFKDYAPELEAYAKEHGVAALDAEIANVSWSEGRRGMVLDNVSPAFEDALRKSLDRQRADAKKAKKEAAASTKPKMAKLLFDKYGLKEGDKVTDSESGQPGVVKFDAKGHPYIKTRDYGDVLVGDRWSNKPRTAEFDESKHPRDKEGQFAEVGTGSDSAPAKPVGRVARKIARAKKGVTFHMAPPRPIALTPAEYASTMREMGGASIETHITLDPKTRAVTDISSAGERSATNAFDVKGKISVHNHPNGSNEPSSSDWEMAELNDYPSFIIVSHRYPSGEVVETEYVRPASGWPSYKSIEPLVAKARWEAVAKSKAREEQGEPYVRGQAGRDSSAAVVEALKQIVEVKTRVYPPTKKSKTRAVEDAA